MPGAPISLQTSPESSNKDRSNYFKDTGKRNLLAFLLLTVLIFIVIIGRGKGDIFVSLPSPFSEFVGREEILKEVRHVLFSGNQRGLSIVVLWGEGGMGKSETAIQFANQALKNFSLVYWINTDSDELFQQSYFNLAQALNIAVDKKTPFERVREKVHMTLENQKFRKPWLLIYDNADRAVGIPQRGNGKILITTRDKTQWDFAKCIEMIPFSEKNAQQLYKKVICTEKAVEEWSTLAKQLDYHPLALNQALHFVKESPHFSVPDYLSILEKNKRALLNHTSGVIRYPKNLLTIWQVSANTIKSTDTHAYAWLEICACLHPDKIPVKWLESWLIFENKASKKEAKLEANNILRLLANQGHIRLSQDLEYFSIHRLKQELIKLTNGPSNEESGRALCFLSHLVKDYEFIDSLDWHDDHWGELLDWEASAAWWLSTNIEYSKQIKDQIILLNVLGNIRVIIKGKCAEGIEFYQRVLDMYNCNQDIHSSKSIIYSLISKGQCFFLFGQYQKALDLGNAALRLTLGAPTKERARCLLYLSTFLNFHGYARKAIEYAEEALKIFQSSYDSEPNAEICEAIKLLGNFWKFGGDYEKAIQLSLEALNLNRALFGKKENIQRSYILINLGRAFRAIGELDIALKCHLEAYRIEQKIFFSDTYLPIVSLKEIAIDYCAKKKYSQSLKYTDKALQIAESMKDTNYLQATRTQLILNLSEIYLGIGKTDKAICYLNKALDKFNILSQRGVYYLYVDIYGGLGRAYCKQGNFEKGIEFFEKIFEFQKTFFLEMPNDLSCIIENLVSACEKVHPEKAVQYRQLLKDLETQSLSIEQKHHLKKECLEAMSFTS